MGLFKDTQRERFWGSATLAANPEKCWEWQGAVMPNGYGSARFSINGKWWRYPHRIAFYFYFGVDPQNLCVCHKCDNRKCVNPNHLFLGTYAENLSDMRRKGRGAKGEKHGTARLKEFQVIEIIEQLKTGGRVFIIAKAYGVSRGAIYGIKRGENWAHLQKGLSRASNAVAVKFNNIIVR